MKTIFIPALICVAALAESPAGEMHFNFHLDGSYRTSAGAYKPDGTLVRTLWNNRTYGLGTYKEVWDGKDDYGKTVPDGTYEIHLIHHNVTYTWEGVIGNTSKDKSGDLVHRIYTAASSMAIAGTKATYAEAYAEGYFNLLYFDTTDPQVMCKYNVTRPLGISPYVATDGNIWYRAYHGVWCGEYPTCTEHNAWVTGRKVSDGTVVTFPQGQVFNSANAPGSQVNEGNAPYFIHPSAIDRTTSPTETPNQSGSRKVEPSGLTVQRIGKFLFVAHHNLNSVHVLNKTTGEAITKVTLTQPRQVAAQSAGHVWLIHDVNGVGTVQKFKVNDDGSFTPGLTLSGLGQPIALAVSYDDSVVLAADKATSQVKAFRCSDGVLQWTLGRKGGYENDSAVSDDRFDWSPSWAFLACAPDGCFWVGDTGNSRMIKFGKSRKSVTAIYAIAGHRSYASTADLNNPTRVFCGSLEYKIDYSQQLGPTSGWKLAHNWWYPDSHWGFPGIHSAATLSNGRTYALVLKKEPANPADRVLWLYELPANGIARDTGVRVHPNSGLYADGSNRYAESSDGVVKFMKKPLKGFDGWGNPIYGAPQVMASAPTVNGEGPYWHGTCYKHRLFQTASGLITSLGESKWSGGPFHLGGIKPGAMNWLWRAFPEINDTNIPANQWNGGYQVGGGVGNSAGIQVVEGKNIVVAFFGEGWHSGQANQHMHFYENGLFVGQFGVENINGGKGVIAGASGNSVSPSLVKANGKLYYYLNDECNASGLHRWCIDGADKIQELSGKGTLGSTIKLAQIASGR